jgi:hypothetical protein
MSARIRHLVVLVFALSCGLTALPAQAEIFGELRFGTGLASGHHEFEANYFDNELRVSQVAHDEGGPLGVPIVLEGMGGYAVSRAVAFGIVGRVEVAPYFESVTPRYAQLNGHMLAAAGPMLVWRPDQVLDLRLAVEWVGARFIGSNIDIGADDNVFDFENLGGPGALFSLGCCSERGFGIAMEMHVARLTSEHQTFVPITLTLMATLASR